MLRNVKNHQVLRYLTYFSLIFLFFFSQHLLNWPMLTFSHFRGQINFADLFAVLKNVDCYPVIRDDIFTTKMGDPCRNYIYGITLIKVLNFFHLGTNYVFPVAIFLYLFASAVLASILLILPSRLARFVFLGVVVIAPPMNLLIERTNFDVLIFILIFWSSFIFGRSQVFSILLLSLATSFKFYTFPLLALFLVKIRRRNLVIVAMPVMFLLLQIRTDLLRIRSIDVNTATSAFGLPVWGLYLDMLGIQTSKLMSSLLGMLLLALCLTLIARYRLLLFPSKIRIFDDLGSVSIWARFSSMCVLVFLSCFFVGMNYDYRLVFLLIGSTFYLFQDSGSYYLLILKVATLVASAWLSYEIRILQPLGDVAIFFLVAFYVFAIVEEVLERKRTMI